MLHAGLHACQVERKSGWISMIRSGIEKKFSGTLIVLLLVVVFASLVDSVFADVPVVSNVEPWTRSSDNHTVLNITITHRNYYSGHYVDWIQVDLDGTVDTVDLSPPQPVNLPFIVQYDMGLVSGNPMIRARAHCNLHGSSAWASPIDSDDDLGDDSRAGGLFNPNATVQADVNLVFQIVIFLVLAFGLLMAKARRSFQKHGLILGVAVVLHTVSILVVMVPSLVASRGLLADLSAGLALVVLSHAVLGSLVGILGIYLVGTWAANRKNVQACFKRKTAMRATVLLWLVELITGIYAYVLLYISA